MHARLGNPVATYRDGKVVWLQPDEVFALLGEKEEAIMAQQIEVILENGLLRPLGPLPAQFHEHQRYLVKVELIAPDTAQPVQPVASLEEVRQALAHTPGTLSETVIRERDKR